MLCACLIVFGLFVNTYLIPADWYSPMSRLKANIKIYRCEHLFKKHPFFHLELTLQLDWFFAYMEPMLHLWIDFWPALSASPRNCSIPESRVENCGLIRTRRRTEKLDDVILTHFRVYLTKLDAVVLILCFSSSRCWFSWSQRSFLPRLKQKAAFRNIGAQTGVCTARSFTRFCDNSAQAIWDVISVRFLTRNFIQNLRSVSRDLDGRFSRELFTFRERDFLARFLRRVIFVPLKTYNADSLLSQL